MHQITKYIEKNIEKNNIFDILKKTQSNTMGYLALCSYSYPLLYIDYSTPNILYIIFIFYMADLISGMLHIFLDNYKGDNPYILPHAKGFMHHHEDPREFTTRPISLVLTETSIGVILFNIINCYFIDMYFLLFTFLVHIVQLSHYQAHCINHNTLSPNISKILKYLQRYYLILPTKVHSKHHETFDNNFCILNGWANPLLNNLYKISETYTGK